MELITGFFAEYSIVEFLKILSLWITSAIAIFVAITEIISRLDNDKLDRKAESFMKILYRLEEWVEYATVIVDVVKKQKEKIDEAKEKRVKREIDKQKEKLPEQKEDE